MAEVQIPDGLEDEGNIEILFDEEDNIVDPSMLEMEGEVPFEDNLAEYIDDGTLTAISSELLSAYQDDVTSREDWYETFKKGLELLGIDSEPRSEPFEGASGVYHPLLAEAVTHFQAQAYKELLPANGPVDTKVMGASNDPKAMQANRVKDFMNFQLMYKMEEYDPEMDQMLFFLPLAGSAFKKCYFDPAMGRVVSRFVKAEDLVVPYNATDLHTTPRVSHRFTMTENDLRKLQLSGFYLDTEMHPSSMSVGDDSVQDKINQLDGVTPSQRQEDFSLIEMHVELDIEGFEHMGSDGEPTGLALPYIVTICTDNNDVLAIRRNYVENDPMRKKVEYFTHYKFLPGLGFYGFGLIHMIGGVTKSATAILRQLIDAGTLANLPAGFKSRGLNIQRADDPVQPGEWRDVDAPGGSIREAFMPLPYKEPSATLAQLLGLLVESGQRFAAVMDNQTGDGNSNAPVGTTVALLEKGQKVISSIHKRLHYAQRSEFKILKRLFGEYLPPEYPYQVQGASQTVFAEDFNNTVDVIPVCDPNIFSTTQRIILAQTQLQMAQSAPQIHNMKEAFRKMYIALNIKDIDDLLIPDIEPAPKDPVQENMDAAMGMPLKAFIQQNHDAHIQAHMAFMQSPQIQQNPQAMAALQAHIQEHIALKYRIQVEEMMAQQGIQLPQAGPDGQMPQLPPEAESQIAIAAAQATQQITGQEQALAQAMAAQQQDPAREMFDAQMDLELEKLKQRDRDSERKAMLERERIESQEQQTDIRVASELQQAEMRDEREVDSNLTDIAKIVRDSREQE
tara:strand:+ start:4318 stop:6690 length:2373 start_codon:yes stop_codon:yes gene_type:complete